MCFGSKSVYDLIGNAMVERKMMITSLGLIVVYLHYIGKGRQILGLSQ